MIEIHKVRKRFGSRLAVEDLSLNVAQGRIFGLLGHNGAGKSTTIGMLLGQVWPDAGRIRINGHDVQRHRNKALARTGAIFESPVFHDYLSGRRNLEILASYSAPTPAARILEVIEWVGLTGREEHRVRTYSHGMRARLALAQALLPNPDLLILDEPTDGLDPEGIHEMRDTIRRLHREMNLTILLSSHLLAEVEQLCDEIAVMFQGRLVYSGPMSQVLETRNQARLQTPDFTGACARLQELQLITRAAPPDRITLTDDATVEEIVRQLVASNHPVQAIHPVGRTLEDFYLTVTREQPGARNREDRTA